jgi:hypothetical protein
MSNPASSTQAPTSRKKLTATRVIEMFQALNLPVTDDAQLIEAKANELKPRFQQMKNHTDPHRRAEAEVWFKDLAEVELDLDKLLGVIRDHFEKLSNTALKAAREAGLTTLTAELVENLQQLAMEECRCDPALAEHFLTHYRAKHKYELDQPTVWPGSARDFQALSGLRSIQLIWTPPLDNCDEIKIVRTEQETRRGRKRAQSQEMIFRRSPTDTRLDDHEEVLPGVRYSYTLSVIYQGVEGPGETRTVVCMAELGDLKATWADERVRLGWTLPDSVASGAKNDQVSVLAFRRRDGPPELNRDVLGVQPTTPATVQLYPQDRLTLEDNQVEDGATYFYHVLLDYKNGDQTPGLSTQLTVPAPPPAVSVITTCAHKQNGTDNEIELAWSPVVFAGQVEYEVFRRDGSVPPDGPEPGWRVGVTREARFVDARVLPGHRYTYAVFSHAERHSRVGMATSPVDILSDVTDLAAQDGDRSIDLSWRPPASVSRILVRRGIEPPKDSSDGSPVSVTGAANAIDSGLVNGQRYHYLVCCAYRPAGTGEVVSPGVRIDARAEPSPQAATDFKVWVEGEEILCSWASPEHGQVVIVRSDLPSPWRFGDRLSIQELDQFGDRIPCEAARAVVRTPDASRPYYHAFSVGSAEAVASGSGYAVVVPPISNLTLSATQDGIILRWAWPSACTAVRVVRRLGQWPCGPEDSEAVCTPYTRAEYHTAGHKFVDKIGSVHGRAEYYYAVYALAAGAPFQYFSRCETAGCRAQIEWAPWMTLSYWYALPERSRENGQGLHLRWALRDVFPEFAGFALVANESHPPSGLSDGVDLFRWHPPDGGQDGEHEAWVSLDPVRVRGWATCYCKAMVLEPAQRHVTLIIHPNTCVPITSQGIFAQTQRSPSKHRAHPGAPRTFVCPTCLAEYPVETMLFESFAGGDPVRVRYTWWDRVRHNSITPPVGPHGEKLYRKVCPSYDPARPETRHYLPYTAGAQESLVIGVIGAKFSGKSHYIAALINRLEGQTGLDMRASLLAVTDETSDRYRREFYDPLFGRKLELPVTVGTPDPLIYDLYLDGALFHDRRQRAVTLALYDTAGENFDHPTTVQKMVRYLKMASGVIFLIDPLQCPAVHEAVPSSIPLPDLELMAEPNEVLNRVLTELQDHELLVASEPLTIPVAVVLTKCDVLSDHGLIDLNRLWNTDKRHIGSFDLQAHDDMNGMIGEYVQQWSKKAYALVTSRFSQHAFFGVSATGCAADKATHRYPNVSPWRVEDPLLWLLATLDVIPTRDFRRKEA